MIEKQYYSIGEVAEIFNVNISLLRYWETEFPFITPKKNSKGTRFYSNENIDDIKIIFHLVKVQKLTLEGAKKKIKENKDGVRKNAEILSRLNFVKNEIASIRKEFRMSVKNQDKTTD